MKSTLINCRVFVGSILICGSFIVDVSAQAAALERERSMIDSAGDRYIYTFGFIVIAALIGAGILWWRSKQPDPTSQYEYSNRLRERQNSYDHDDSGVHADKEMEWFRSAKKSTSKVEVRSRNADRRHGRRRLSETVAGAEDLNDLLLDTRAFQERMKKIQYAQLPINSFLQLTAGRPFAQLPISGDPALLSAIEQAQEEYEDDESVRELAVRILAAFRNRNSVEALSQIALYDLSSNVRSKAVAALTEFDHESVFEAMLLACADPTREVRAAAARGLFRFSFDRAEAWKRLIDSKDVFRMRHAARAAIESGIVQKSFDRLLHDEMSISYEAFSLIGLVIKSGETEIVFEAIMSHPDERIRTALLHVIKIVKDETSLNRLEEMVREESFPKDLTKQAVEAIKGIEAIAA